MSWLNTFAPLNILIILATLPVFQKVILLILELRLDDWNALAKLVMVSGS